MQGKIADIFQVDHKKFFTSVTGRTYDAGKKPTKAEKKELKLKELELKKEKLKRQMPKVEKQDQTKEKETDKPATTVAADEDMTMLISDSKEEQE